MSTELTSLKAEKEKLTSELMNNSSVSSDRLTQLEAENKDLKVSILDFSNNIICIPDFNTNISHQLIDFTITFVSSQH